MALYGVKILYRYVVGGETFYEESILRVRAEDFNEAIAMAEEYANDNLDDEHINPLGLKVKESLCDIIDCFAMQESGGAIEEVYSNIMKNRTDLSDSEYVELMYDTCSAEELKELRYWAFNEGEK